MTLPFHSIVMISYQQRALVDRAVKSVLDQDDEDWELIAVDDGSTDGTLARLQQLALEDRRIHVVSKPNTRLPSISRNVGLEKVRGRIVSFLDGDDMYAAGRLSAIRRGLNACPDANLIFGDYKPFGMQKWDEIHSGYLHHLKMDERYISLGDRMPSGDVCIESAKLLPVLIGEFFGAFTLNIAVPRDVIDQRKLRFDETRLMAEDHDFVVRALEAGRAVFVREVLGHWLRQPSTISSTPSAKGHRDAYEVLEKHLDGLDANALPAAARSRVRERLSEHAFEWGFAASQLGNFGEARKAYGASFKYKPERRQVIAWTKALLHLSRKST